MKNKGITLIALVITIIVLLILAGITISLTIGNQGVITRAQQASRNYKDAEQKEQEELNNFDGEVDNIITGLGGNENLPEDQEEPEKGPKAGTILEDQKPSEWTSKEVKPMADGNGGIIPLPTGYYYLGGDYDNGLVISDKVDDDMDARGTTSGNQFVWIPVIGTTDQEKKEYFKREHFKSDGTTTGNSLESYGFYEPSQTGHQYPDEQSDYNKMYNSVIKYGGFYIGRYEAGINDDSGDTSPRTDGTEAQEVVSKAGVWPYNNVPWGKDMEKDIGTDAEPSGAVYLAKNKYLKPNSDQAKSVVSTLVYGIQWDTMCKYIGPSKASMEVSKKEKLEKTRSDDADEAKNIYDLAGSCNEWTMEMHEEDHLINGDEVATWWRTIRGGVYLYPDYVAARDWEDNACRDLDGFRLALYIK